MFLIFLYSPLSFSDSIEERFADVFSHELSVFKSFSEFASYRKGQIPFIDIYNRLRAEKHPFCYAGAEIYCYESEIKQIYDDCEACSQLHFIPVKDSLPVLKAADKYISLRQKKLSNEVKKKRKSFFHRNPELLSISSTGSLRHFKNGLPKYIYYKNGSNRFYMPSQHKPVGTFRARTKSYLNYGFPYSDYSDTYDKTRNPIVFVAENYSYHLPDKVLAFRNPFFLPFLTSENKNVPAIFTRMVAVFLYYEINYGNKCERWHTPDKCLSTLSESIVPNGGSPYTKPLHTSNFNLDAYIPNTDSSNQKHYRYTRDTGLMLSQPDLDPSIPKSYYDYMMSQCERLYPVDETARFSCINNTQLVAKVAYENGEHSFNTTFGDFNINAACIEDRECYRVSMNYFECYQNGILNNRMCGDTLSSQDKFSQTFCKNDAGFDYDLYTKNCYTKEDLPSCLDSNDPDCRYGLPVPQLLANQKDIAKTINKFDGRISDLISNTQSSISNVLYDLNENALTKDDVYELSVQIQDANLISSNIPKRTARAVAKKINKQQELGNTILLDIATKTAETNSKLDALTSAVGNISIDGIGDNIGSATVLNSYYTPEYESGFSGVLETHIELLKNTSTYQTIQKFTIESSQEALPEFELCFDAIGPFDFGCDIIAISDNVINFIRAILLFTCVAACRQIIFRG